MTRESPRMRMQKLARIDRELSANAARAAELLAERASVLDGLATRGAHPVTGRAAQRPPEAKILAVSELATARAKSALRDLRTKGRVAR